MNRSGVLSLTLGSQSTSCLARLVGQAELRWPPRHACVELQWQHIDPPRRRLMLPDSTTGQKTIFLNEGAIAVLTGLSRLKNNPHVVPGRAFGSCLANIHSAWVQVKTRAGLVDVRLHDLRHSFASVAVDAGGSAPLSFPSA